MLLNGLEKTKPKFFMKIVLDTNVIISGLFWNGLPGKVLEKALKEHTLCFTSETLTELKTTLLYPKFASHFQKLDFTIDEFLTQITENALVVSEPLQKISVIKEDPSDNKFLACAISCQASFIVSGDNHLLKLKNFKNIPIVQPKEFLKIIF